ncbi:hypothetical protein H9P43_009995 [Blastocladiella emersonii ATCC 22665]|nr:hypothetical protein H9P43_009995 [Blastocladiella emersonii ATCC 22665]
MNEDLRQLWAVKALNVLISLVLQYFVVSSVSILLNPLMCHPATNTLVSFKSTPCFQPSTSLAPAIAGILATAILVPLLLATTLTSVTPRYPKNEILACSNPIFNMFSVVFTVAFVIMGEYLGHGVWPPVVSAVCYLAMTVFLEYQLLATLPFHHASATRWQSALTCSLIWLSFCGLVSAASPTNYVAENRVIDFVMVIGLLPAGFVGSRLAKARITTFKRLAMLVQVEVDAAMAAGPDRGGPGGRHHHGGMPSTAHGSRTNLTSEIGAALASGIGGSIGGATRLSGGGGGGGCPVVRLDASTEMLNEAPHSAHGRLIANPLVMSLLGDVNCVEIYRAALQIHPNDAAVHLLYCSFADTLQIERAATPDRVPVLTTDAASWDGIPQLEPSLAQRFLLFCRSMDHEQKAATQDVIAGMDKLDLLQYVEFQRSYTEAKRYHAKCVDSIQQFWVLLLSRRVQFKAFEASVRAIMTNTSRADEFYKQLLSRYPKAAHILQAYSDFSRLVLNDSELSATYSNLAEAARAREEELARSGGDLSGGGGEGGGGGMSGASLTHYSKSAVITMDANGTITDVNPGALKVFGYDSKLSLVSRKINLIVPHPWRSFHDFYLERYRQTGVKRFMGPKQRIFGQHAKGYAFPMDLQVVELKGAQRLFAGLITPVADLDSTAMIIINKEGKIQMHNKFATTMLGFSSSQMVGENVNMIMPPDHASHHDSYLQRFLETGVPHVIGTTGRCLMAKEKSGKFIPVSLEVNELVINGDTYFRGTMLDLRQLTAEVCITGSGEIKSVNDDTYILFGWARDGLVGKNVKMLMPEPYRSFHDSYLDRHRRTRACVMMTSLEGRIYPAVHRDGTVFTVRIRVQAVPSSFGGTEPMYKATINRINDNYDPRAEKTREENRIQVSMSGHITATGAFFKERWATPDLPGRSLAVLFPPVPQAPHQANLRTLLDTITASLPTTQFYTLVLRRDKTLLPMLVSGCELDDGIELQTEDLILKEGLITLDEAGKITQSNDDFAALVGVDIEQLLGRPLATHIQGVVTHPESGGYARQALAAVHRDGSTFPVNVEVCPRTDPETGMASFMVRVVHGPIAYKVSPDIIRSLHLGGTRGGAGESSSSLSPSAMWTTALRRPEDGSVPDILSRSHSHRSSDSIPADPNGSSGGSSTMVTPGQSMTSPQVTRARVIPPSVPEDSESELDPRAPRAASIQRSVRDPAGLAPPDEDGLASGGGGGGCPVFHGGASPTPTGPRRVSVSLGAASVMGAGTMDSGATATATGAKVLTLKTPQQLKSETPANPRIVNSAYDTDDDTVATQSVVDNASVSGSDTESQTTRGDRNSRLILAWKSSKTNPLHGALQRRLWVSFIVTALAAIAVVVVFSVKGKPDFNMVRVAADHVPIVSSILQKTEQLYFCNVVVPAAPALASSPLCAEDIRGKLVAYGQRLSELSTAFNAMSRPNQPLQIDTPVDVSLKLFVLTDPRAATEAVIPDVWQVFSRMSAACAAMANVTGDPTASRHWNFLTANKDQLLSTVFFFSDKIDNVVINFSNAETYSVIIATLSLPIIALAVFLLVLWPEVRNLNRERSKALVLLTGIPRHVIQYLAYQVYELDDADWEDEDREETRPAEGEQLQSLSHSSHEHGDSAEAIASHTAAAAAASTHAVTGSMAAVPGSPFNPLHRASFFRPSEKDKRSSKPMVAGTDYRAYVIVATLYAWIMIPSLVLVLFRLARVQQGVQCSLQGMQTAVAFHTTIYPMASVALEVARPGTNWTQRAATLNTQVHDLRVALRQINSLVSRYDDPAPTRALLTSAYAYTATSNIDASLAGTASSRGYAYVLEDALQAVQTIAGAPGGGSAPDANTHAALAAFLGSVQGDLDLGTRLLLERHLGDIDAASQADGAINLNVHVAVIFLVVVVHYGLFRFQQRMREDIKQNCLLLLMVPQAVINRQKPLKQYLRGISQGIRRHMGAAAADAPAGLHSVRRT